MSWLDIQEEHLKEGTFLIFPVKSSSQTGKLTVYHSLNRYGYSLELGSSTISAQYYEIDALRRMISTLISRFNLSNLYEIGNQQ